MNPGNGANRVEQSVRVYRRLLAIFPTEFRQRFGDEMAQAFRDSLRDANQVGRYAVAAFWLRTLVDAALCATYERIALVSRRTAQRLQDVFPSVSIASLLKFGVAVLCGHHGTRLCFDAVRVEVSPSDCASRLLLASLLFGAGFAVSSPPGWMRHRRIHVVRSLAWSTFLVLAGALWLLQKDGRLTAARYELALWVPVGVLFGHRMCILAKSFTTSLKLAHALNAECKADRPSARAIWRIRYPRSSSDLHIAWTNMWALDQQAGFIEKKAEGFRSLRLPHRVMSLLLIYWLTVTWPDLSIALRSFAALAILISAAGGAFANVDESPPATDDSATT